MKQTDLGDYAVIGDCRTAALVSKYGSIDWLCLPDFDSPSLFAALVGGENGGCFSIGMKDHATIERRYLPDTAILETTHRSAQGAIRLTDCMPVLPDARHSTELEPLREILRRVEVTEGSAVIEVMLDARPYYGKHESGFRFRGELGWAFQRGKWLLNLISNFPLELRGGALLGSVTASAGDCYWFSLTFERCSPGVLLPIGAESQHRIAITERWWSAWSRQCHYDGKWRNEVMRSAITLRLMTCTLSGALLAAATTSLPEKPGGWMNWDYRYCWPRDAALTLSAFMAIGLRKEADAFFNWLMLAASLTAPRLNVMYDLYGHYQIKERFLPWLSGYAGSKPVRIGNALTFQIQHDVYGEVMLAVEDWIAHFGTPDADECQLIQGFGKALKRQWRAPDNGIWEIRGERHHYTYSKVMAWHVFDSLLRLNKKQHLRIPADYCRERDALRDAIEREGFNRKRNCYTAVFGKNSMDASLLLLPRVNYIDYNDPRMQGTWQAIREDLEVNGLILRYPPGFAGSEPGEGALIICNFWAVDYLTGAGRRDEAEERLTRLAKLANDVGLYNEGADTQTFKPLGNMPQAFSHAGFINSVLMLTRDKGQQAKKAA